MIPHLCPSSKILKSSLFINHHCTSITIDFKMVEESLIVKFKASDVPKIAPSTVKVDATFVFAKNGNTRSVFIQNSSDASDHIGGIYPPGFNDLKDRSTASTIISLRKQDKVKAGRKRLSSEFGCN